MSTVFFLLATTAAFAALAGALMQQADDSPRRARRVVARARHLHTPPPNRMRAGLRLVWSAVIFGAGLAFFTVAGLLILAALINKVAL